MRLYDTYHAPLQAEMERPENAQDNPGFFRLKDIDVQKKDESL